MKTVLSFVFLAILAISAFAGDVSYRGIRPDFIIDVRTPEEFASGHIEGAINVPVEVVGQSIRAVKGVKPESKLLVYCRSGRRSAAATAVLKQEGYSNVTDGGGIDALAQSLKKCSSSDPC